MYDLQPDGTLHQVRGGGEAVIDGLTWERAVPVLGALFLLLAIIVHGDRFGGPRG